MENLVSSFLKEVAEKLNCKSEDLKIVRTLNNQEPLELTNSNCLSALFNKEEGGFIGNITLMKGEDPISKFRLTFTPGNYQTLFFSDSYVYVNYRNLKIGKLTHAFRLNIAKGLEVKEVFCTYDSNNQNQVKILKSFGWNDIKKLYETIFLASKTI
jgi:hypothetical protein